MAHHLGKKVSEYIRGKSVRRTGRLHLDGIVAKVRQFEFFAQKTAICMRIGGDAPRPGRRKFLQF